MSDWPKKASTIITLDVIFRAALGAGFVIMLVMASRMPSSSFGNPAVYPTFIGVIGLGLWAGLIVQDLINGRRGRRQGRIYDIAFEVGHIPTFVVWLRTFAVFGMLGVLILGVWLLSFQLAIPLFLLVYLKVLGKTSWRLAISMGLTLEIPIVVLYGAVINTAWPDSVLEGLLGFTFQSILEKPVIWLLF